MATASTTCAAVCVTTPRDGVAVVTLNRPAKMNALNDDVWKYVAVLTPHTLLLTRCTVFSGLISEFGKLACDSSVRAIVLCGAGKAFTAGLDLVASASLLEYVCSPRAPPRVNTACTVRPRHSLRAQWNNVTLAGAPPMTSAAVLSRSAPRFAGFSAPCLHRNCAHSLSSRLSTALALGAVST